MRTENITIVLSGPSGTRYPVNWTLSSAGPEANPGDNTAVTQVTAAWQIFLPILLRGD
jgi:hypothetical protein